MLRKLKEQNHRVLIFSQVGQPGPPGTLQPPPEPLGAHILPGGAARTPRDPPQPPRGTYSLPTHPQRYRVFVFSWVWGTRTPPQTL